MLALGYDHINLDDCWGVRNNQTHQIEGDPTRFPEGMPAFIKKLHAMGFKFGLYTDIGTMGCHHPFVGSWPDYQRDANTFAAWEVDYVKFDGCKPPEHMDVGALTCNMSQALNNTGRDMWLNFHCWHDERCAQCGNSFRIFNDHHDSWSSTSSVIDFLAQHRQKYWGPDPTYGWPDPDFIFTGGQGCAPRGKINPPGQRCPGQSDAEYLTEYSIWAIAGGQIVMATDPRNMTDVMKKVLYNKEVIAVFQDTSGFQQVTMLPGAAPELDSVQVWVRPVADGGVAAVLMNPGVQPSNITLSFEQVSSKGWSKATTLEVRDLWEQKDLGKLTGSYTAQAVPSHGSVFLKLSVPTDVHSAHQDA